MLHADVPTHSSHVDRLGSARGSYNQLPCPDNGAHGAAATLSHILSFGPRFDNPFRVRGVLHPAGAPFAC